VPEKVAAWDAGQLDEQRSCRPPDTPVTATYGAAVTIKPWLIVLGTLIIIGFTMLWTFDLWAWWD
jgi:hypothetical protein